MISTQQKHKTCEMVNLRIRLVERNLIDRAADSVGKTRSAFIVEAARRAAEDTLLDRAMLSVSAEAYAEFLKRLEAPPQANARLNRTMQIIPPWSTS
jgi:uncharacterized protein (DUF1778 family)